MSAVENLITDNLPIWSSSVQLKSSSGRGTSSKRTLYGVKKLRELILDLAVRGLLVPQDPNDQPASILLEKIVAEKQRYFDEGKIKKKKISLPLKAGKSKLKLPQNWAIGSGFPKNIQGSNYDTYLFAKVSDMNLKGNEKYLRAANNTVSEAVVKEYRLKLHPAGTVVFPKIGGAIATNKRRILSSSAIFDNNCLGIVPFRVMLSEYLFVLLSSFDFTKYQAGTSVPALSQSVLEMIEVGLPSVEEQHRIIAKVDELMALCDTLEQQQEDSIQAHETLVETLLEALTDAADADAFQAAWQRISKHFDVLFTTEHSIDKLKETILQLAVMGKLVPQDPNDEPANILLEKMAAEKDQLIAGGKVKKQKNLPVISVDEKCFELPEGWMYCRLQSIVTLLGDGLHGTPSYDESGSYYFVNGNNLNDGVISIKPDTKRVNEQEYDKYKKQLNSRTVLVSINGTLGNVAFYSGERIMLGKSACYFNLGAGISKQFIRCLIKSPYFVSFAFSKATGSTIKNLGLKSMNNFPIALPPVKEQHRIVAKVDELMALCDQLKGSLQQAQQIQIHLTDAVVENAI
jgi:type I restriction enzyme S subunit